VVVDGKSPKRIERPSSPEELAEVLCGAAAAGEAVIPVGGGRALGLGDPPRRFDLALETTGLNRMLEMSQADLTVSAEAGVKVEDLNAELAQVGQFLPLDPFNAPGHTVGGVLAAALSGPLRLRYGSARDFTIGLRVALPDGRLATSGGRVVKNVSGYDLNKLHQGALGSLGVIVAASFKVYPRPLYEASVATSTGDLDQAWREARRALALSLVPTALELGASGNGSFQLHGRFEGSRKGVERTVSELGWNATDDAFWSEHSRRGSDTWARISVPPRSLLELVRSIPASHRWWCSPGVGVAHWPDAADAEEVRGLRARAERAGGSLVLLAAPVELKAAVGAWGSLPATMDWMRRIKDAFDPGHAISPGRYPV
jgi:glycolate oxidase FAD binding subunit